MPVAVQPTSGVGDVGPGVPSLKGRGRPQRARTVFSPEGVGPIDGWQLPLLSPRGRTAPTPPSRHHVAAMQLRLGGRSTAPT